MVGDDLGGLEFSAVGIHLESDRYLGSVTRIVRRLSDNLTAVETAFGWVLHEHSQATSAVVSSSQVIVLKATVSDQERTSIPISFW